MLNKINISLRTTLFCPIYAISFCLFSLGKKVLRSYWTNKQKQELRERGEEKLKQKGKEEEIQTTKL